MGIIEKGINGPFRGKAGSVIGSSWKKINYIKGLHRFKNRRPPSEEQVIQRQKFQLLNDFLRRIKHPLSIGFGQFTSKATAVNAAFSHNFDDAFSVDGNDIVLNYPALKLSSGSLCTAGTEKAWIEGGGIRISWNAKTYGMGGEMDDVAYAIVYSPSIDVFFSNWSQATRHDGATYVDFLNEEVGDELHIWLFFTDKQRKRVSKSIYIPLTGSVEHG